MLQRVLAASLLSASSLAGCAVHATESTSESGLEIGTMDDTTVAGSFVHGGSVIDFRSISTDQSTASLVLDINGAMIEMTFDQADKTFAEDGHLNALYGEDLAALVALRDALIVDLAGAPGSLQASLLVRYADRLAEAPVGYTLVARAIVFDQRLVQDRADDDGCGGNGTTCLSGTNGYATSMIDTGSNGVCDWEFNIKYGNSAPSCRGRCGPGCGVTFGVRWDDDYHLDCLEHDRCLEWFGGSTATPSNPNCGDEYNDAADDWAVSVGDSCPEN